MPGQIMCGTSPSGLLLLDRDGDWSKPLWQWQPTADPNITAEQRAWFVEIRDVKYAKDGRYALIADSGGAVALVGCNGNATTAWFTGQEQHSAALLPDDNIVVAQTSGQLCLIATSHDASPDPANPSCSYYDMPDAHAVLWDKKRHCLWAVGDVPNTDAPSKPFATVYCFPYKPSPVSPSFGPPKTQVFNDPKKYKYGGHDLYPAADGQQVFIACAAHTFKFDPSTTPWTIVQWGDDDPNHTLYSYGDVKAVSQWPETGEIALAIPQEVPPDKWLGNTIYFFTGPNTQETKTHPSARWYKARWWTKNIFSD